MFTVEKVSQQLFRKYRNVVRVSGYYWYVFKNHYWVCHYSIDNMLILNNHDVNIWIQENIKDVLCQFTKLITTAYGNTFERQLNKQSHLIGFNNGVFDLKTKKFRNGKPEDMISNSVGYNYCPSKSNYEQLMKFLTDLQPDEKKRDELLDFLASLLEGNTSNDKINFFLGSGSNGKSTLLTLLEHTFGKYFNPSLFSGIFDHMTLTKRVTAYRDYDEFTRNSKIVKRILAHEEINGVSPQFKMIFCVNVMPKITDEGLARRFRIFEFPTRFVFEPKNENERKINWDFHCKYLNQTLMSVLLERYYKLKEVSSDKPVELNDILGKISSDDLLKICIDNSTVSVVTKIIENALKPVKEEDQDLTNATKIYELLVKNPPKDTDFKEFNFESILSLLNDPLTMSTITSVFDKLFNDDTTMTE
ncbi:hypothetical protein FJZ55_10655, partial [Candidatus Woesearchaeota archaeon]|nr:hypothetical protein [Candidatus Woesearchaeota archaeon]